MCLVSNFHLVTSAAFPTLGIADSRRDEHVPLRSAPLLVVWWRRGIERFPGDTFVRDLENGFDIALQSFSSIWLSDHLMTEDPRIRMDVWTELTWIAARYPGPRLGTIVMANSFRIDQMVEAIKLMRTMWSESPATFEGTYYCVGGAYCEPRPDPAPNHRFWRPVEPLPNGSS